MFGKEFSESSLSSADPFPELKHRIHPQKDKGFDPKSTSSRFVPEVEEHDNFARAYCRAVSPDEYSTNLNDFDLLYTSVITDLSNKFITAKQSIMLMFQQLDEYDQEALACGLHAIFPDRHSQEQQSEHCRRLHEEVTQVIQVIENDINVCSEPQSQIFESTARKKTKAIQDGCLPVTRLRDRIVHELDYVLQRYQIHVNVVLNVAHEKGKHKEARSIWQYIKDTATQTVQIVKRGLTKLLSFLKRNWDKVMLTALLVVGPLYFVGIPTFSSGFATLFKEATLFDYFGLKWGKFTTNFLCSLLTQAPFVGYIMYKMLTTLFTSYYQMTQEEKNKKFGEASQQWTRALSQSESFLSDQFGMNLSSVLKGTKSALGVSSGVGLGGTLALGVGVAKVGLKVGETVGKGVIQGATELQKDVKDNTYGGELVEFSTKLLGSGTKYVVILILQKVANMFIQGVCLVMQGTAKATEIVDQVLTGTVKTASSWWNYASQGITKLLYNTAEEVKLPPPQTFWDKVGPGASFLKILLQLLRDPSDFSNIMEEFLRNEEATKKVLQFVFWGLNIILGLKKLFSWGAVPPDTTKLAKLTPLLRSKVIDENLVTLRLPVQPYLKKPEGKSESVKKRTQSRRRTISKGRERVRSKSKPREKMRSRSKSKSRGRLRSSKSSKSSKTSKTSKARTKSPRAKTSSHQRQRIQSNEKSQRVKPKARNTSRTRSKFKSTELTRRPKDGIETRQT